MLAVSGQIERRLHFTGFVHLWEFLPTLPPLDPTYLQLNGHTQAQYLRNVSSLSFFAQSKSATDSLP